MITIAGEALMDVLVDSSGSVTMLPGGAPFNVARMVGRLGADCQFLGRLSDDVFGRRLRAVLERERVTLTVPEPVDAPTTLALAELNGHGAADYRFYLRGTAAAQLEPGDVGDAVLADSRAVVLGGLGLVADPIASTLTSLIEDAPADTTVVLDPNCRAPAFEDSKRYRATLASVLRRTDVVKASVEDLAVLYPEGEARDAVQWLLFHGPAAVIVTDGPAPVSVHTARAERVVPVPVVEVLDTVGAGDAFVAGLIVSWCRQGLSRIDAGDADALHVATLAGLDVARAACTMRGADLPAGFAWSAGSGENGRPWRAASSPGGFPVPRSTA
jgi:fructokinase